MGSKRKFEKQLSQQLPKPCVSLQLSFHSLLMDLLQWNLGTWLLMILAVTTGHLSSIGKLGIIPVRSRRFFCLQSRTSINTRMKMADLLREQKNLGGVSITFMHFSCDIFTLVYVLHVARGVIFFFFVEVCSSIYCSYLRQNWGNLHNSTSLRRQGHQNDNLVIARSPSPLTPRTE